MHVFLLQQLQQELPEYFGVLTGTLQALQVCGCIVPGIAALLRQELAGEIVLAALMPRSGEGRHQIRCVVADSPVQPAGVPSVSDVRGSGHFHAGILPQAAVGHQRPVGALLLIVYKSFDNMDNLRGTGDGFFASDGFLQLVGPGVPVTVEQLLRRQ
ncbi:hypothetical protein D3C81_1616490 [compost metagenome]